MLISYISYIQKHSKTNQKTYSGTWQLARSNTFASRLLIEIRAGRIIIKVNKTHFGKCNTNTKHGTAKHVNQKGKVFMMQWGKWTTCVSFWSHMSWFGNDYNMLCIGKPLSEMRCFHMAHWASSVRGGSVSRGSGVPHTYSEMWFFWKPFRIIPWLLKRVLHLVWVSYYVYIVVEVTLNMAK